jgi:uncharacterized protein with NRDE domain
MCLLVVASRLVPTEPLVVGANRDEVLERPSVPLTVLEPGPPRVVGGRDGLAGGTWLAVNEHGVCAGLTNQPMGEAKDPSKRSRGELPLALARHRTARAAVAAFVDDYRPADFNGAWLLLGDRASLYFVDFTSPDGASARELPPGMHVLENRAFGEPSPKVDLVRGTLGNPTSADAVVDAFRRALTDHRIPEGDERPNAANCVHLDTFGTRSSCLVRVPADAGASPRIWVSDGPPCTAPYVEAAGLWEMPAGAPAEAGQPADQSRTSGL